MSQYRFIDAHRATYSLRLLCRALSVPASSYHRWDTEGRDAQQRRDDAVELLVGEIRRVFEASGESYGAIKVRRQLARDGVRCTSRRTAELMAANDMTGISGRDKITTTTRRDRLAAPFPDLVRRAFQPTDPNTLWYGDIERHEALLNLAVVEGHRLQVVAAGWVKLRAA